MTSLINQLKVCKNQGWNLHSEKQLFSSCCGEKKWNSKGRHFFLLKSSTSCVSASPGFFHSSVLQWHTCGAQRMVSRHTPIRLCGRSRCRARPSRGAGAAAELRAPQLCRCSSSCSRFLQLPASCRELVITCGKGRSGAGKKEGKKSSHLKGSVSEKYFI